MSLKLKLLTACICGIILTGCGGSTDSDTPSNQGNNDQADNGSVSQGDDDNTGGSNNGGGTSASQGNTEIYQRE